MEVFVRRPLAEYLVARESAIREEIRTDDEDRILGADLVQLVEYFAARARVTPLVLDFDAKQTTVDEVMVKAEDFPQGFGFSVREGKSYPKTRVTYHVPFSGNAELFQYKPSAHLLWTHDMYIGSSEATFAIKALSGRAEDVNRESQEVLKSFRQQWQHLDVEVRRFNDGLAARVEAIIKERREAIRKRRAFADALAVPVRRTPAGAVPAAFNVPIVKKPLITKPVAPPGGYQPEPLLQEATYMDILKLIHEFGVTIERHPSLHNGKDEEALRDQLLLILTPHFQSATGETFNKAGKTDILIRHEKANVFVAECKVWRGAQALDDALSQMLGYLTWRDSKAALIVFVRNKEIAPVTAQIESAVAQHSCHVKMTGRNAEGWFSFAFHLPNDRSRGVAVNVLCFHFPPA